MDELPPAPIAELIQRQPGELCPLPVEIIDISIGRGSEDLLRHRLCHEMKALGCMLARYIQHASFGSGVPILRGDPNSILPRRRNQDLVMAFACKHQRDAITAKESLMLKTLGLSASALALAGGLALAETPMTNSPYTGRSAVTSPLPSTGRLLASDIYKANVYDPSENKIGDVTDLIIDSNANVTAAIVSVGGFIGVGQKDVMIPFKDLMISTRNGKDWLTLNRTKDELKMLPTFDKKAEANKM
jgi:PRC-barrel domain